MCIRDRAQPGYLLAWRGTDPKCGHDGKAGALFGYGGIFFLCDAGSHGLYDAGYDLYHAAPRFRIGQAHHGGDVYKRQTLTN